MRRLLVLIGVLALFAAGYAAAGGRLRIIRLHGGESVTIGRVKVVDVARVKVVRETVTETVTTTVADTTSPSGGSSTAGGGGSHPTTTPPQTTAAPGTTTTAPPAGPCGTRIGQQPLTYAHVVWIVFENKSYDEIVGSSAAPYVNSLAAGCGLATSYSAVAHPSLPNYLALTSGGTQGVTDDEPPSTHPIAADSIFAQLGGRWNARNESMPSNCDLGDAYPYAVKHNPAAYYTAIRGDCATLDTPGGVAADAAFTFVTPNLCDDMHDCSVAAGDQWLAANLPPLLASRTYADGGTVVFVTWDEDDSTGANRVATLVVSPYTVPGARSATAFTHYSLLRTTEELLGLGCLGSACTASSMRAAFGL
jgi:hypothetical protein